MNTHVKTMLTLAVLGVLLLFGLTWGWSAMTKPFPQRSASEPCNPVDYVRGQRISPPLVMVNVYNASDRTGLAERTMASFEGQGFGPGSVGNAPKGQDVTYAEVWAKDPSRPDVKLVASRLGPRATVVRRGGGTKGVVVVVGEKFHKLVPGKPSVKVTEDVTLCSPPT
jgi:LytR cell envelope-related transcriptional attenuator